MSVANLRIQQSITTIGNTAELAVRIVKDLAGDDIASSISNSSLTNDAVRSLVLTRMQHNITKMNAK